ncbi:unnamed protein product [Cercopithifilaria johnstoni]|uniref:Uncharacterized protein n=1 Tax=Cercopithifilaria johnstoni TaxID=2874296 RepID=A0A8J2Q3F3_9BILA|nr:unnamed protein product [Cercopithifilaria johnstoni]
MKLNVKKNDASRKTILIVFPFFSLRDKKEKLTDNSGRSKMSPGPFSDNFGRPKMSPGPFSDNSGRSKMSPGPFSFLC